MKKIVNDFTNIEAKTRWRKGLEELESAARRKTILTGLGELSSKESLKNKAKAIQVKRWITSVLKRTKSFYGDEWVMHPLY